jgi:hypothetical protein
MTLHHDLTLKPFAEGGESGYNLDHFLSQATLFKHIAGGISIGQIIGRNGLLFVNGLSFDEAPQTFPYLVDNLTKGAPHELFAFLGVLSQDGQIINRSLLRSMIQGDKNPLSQIPYRLRNVLFNSLGIPPKQMHVLHGLPSPPLLLGTIRAIAENNWRWPEGNPDEVPKRTYATDRDEHPNGYLRFPGLS